MSAAAKRLNITPRTNNQATFLDAVDSNDIVICEGPPGSGKTYLSVACAMRAYKSKEVERIVITRPLVEAGENIGFLPGTLEDKAEPYMKPLWDCFRAYVSPEELQNMLALGIIEILPLAYLRGRTLRKCVIIADEMQNSSPAQMYLALTRLGAGSKMIVSGDLTQMDILGGPTKSGLYVARQYLSDDVPGVSFVQLDKTDIVRHKTVQRITEVWEKKSNNIAEEKFELVSLAMNSNGNGSH